MASIGLGAAAKAQQKDLQVIIGLSRLVLIVLMMIFIRF